MRKIFLSIILASSLYALASHTVFAACRPVYGGGNICEQKGKITIDKFIKNPNNGEFVDSLSPKDSISANGTLEFRLVVKNTDTRSIKTITVKDILPEPLVYVSSPGKFDSATRTISFTIDELKKDESKTLTIQAKANEPKDTECFANLAQVTQARNTNQDTTDFCIQGTNTSSPNQPTTDQPSGVQSTTKGGQPIYSPQKPSENPSTGPELFGLIALLPAGLAGIFLRKRSGR